MTVLIIEDENIEQVRDEFIPYYDCRIVGNLQAALETFKEQLPTIVILDLYFPKHGGYDKPFSAPTFMDRAREWCASKRLPWPRVVLMTGQEDLAKPDKFRIVEGWLNDHVVEDIVLKVGSWPLFGTVMRHKLNRILQEVALSPRQANADAALQSIVGVSPAVQQVRELVRKFAAVEAPVLVLGEMGVGKEVVARAIHDAGPRCSKTLHVEMGPALLGDLAASELFGYKKGAFTHAEADHDGAFKKAEDGTLFLDEIGDLAPLVQAQLLRVVETGQFKPLNGDWQQSHCRLITATNKNLPFAVRDGQFRPELYFRLAILTIRIPALRERREDIPLLVEHFRKQLGAEGITFTAQARQVLHEYAWPGNVRQLRSLIERLRVTRGPEDGEVDENDVRKELDEWPSESVAIPQRACERALESPPKDERRAPKPQPIALTDSNQADFIDELRRLLSTDEEELTLWKTLTRKAVDVCLDCLATGSNAFGAMNALRLAIDKRKGDDPAAIHLLKVVLALFVSDTHEIRQVDFRRFLHKASTAQCSNIHHEFPRVVAAMVKQARPGTYQAAIRKGRDGERLECVLDLETFNPGKFEDGTLSITVSDQDCLVLKYAKPGGKNIYRLDLLTAGVT